MPKKKKNSCWVVCVTSCVCIVTKCDTKCATIVLLCHKMWLKICHCDIKDCNSSSLASQPYVTVLFVCHKMHHKIMMCHIMVSMCTIQVLQCLCSHCVSHALLKSMCHIQYHKLCHMVSDGLQLKFSVLFQTKHKIQKYFPPFQNDHNFE